MCWRGSLHCCCPPTGKAAAIYLPRRSRAPPDLCLHQHCRLRLSHTCRALRAASSSSAGWFPEVRVVVRPDTDAEALGAWLRRTGGE